MFCVRFNHTFVKNYIQPVYIIRQIYLKTMTKYRIKKMLNELPAIDRDIAMKNLPAHLGITRQTFSKILNVKADSAYEPAAITLIKIALFFNCTTEYLLENVPEPITIEGLRVLQSGNTAKELSLSK